MLRLCTFLFLMIPVLYVTAQKIYPVRNDTLWGYTDLQYRVKIPFMYDFAEPFFGKVAAVKKGGNTFLIDRKGREVQKDFSSIYMADYDWGLGIRNDSLHVFNPNGQTIAVLPYNSFSHRGMRDGAAVVFRCKTVFHVLKEDSVQECVCNFVNRKGRILLKEDVETAYYPGKGTLAYRSGSTFRIIDPNGKELGSVSGRNFERTPVRDHLLVENEDGKMGIRNLHDQVLVAHEYEDIQYAYENAFWLKKDTVYALYHLRKGFLTGFEYEDMQVFYVDGYTTVQKDGKYGYMDKNGRLVIDCIYFQAFDFGQGLALVCRDRTTCGYIDKNNKTRIPFRYHMDFSSRFREGFSRVDTSQYFGYINRKGEEVIPLKYYTPYDYVYFRNGTVKLLDKDFYAEYNTNSRQEGRLMQKYMLYGIRVNCNKAVVLDWRNRPSP